MSTPALVPFKKKRTKGGRYSHEITKDEIEQYYHMPCEEASKQLGIGLTILKRICRRMGIEKWPYRQLKRAGKLGDAAAAAAATASGGGGSGGRAAAPASPFAAAGGSPGGGAGGQAALPPPQQDEWGEGEGGGSGSDDSGGSWRAHRGGAAGPVLPLVSMRRQGSEPLPPPPPPPPARQHPAAPPRRRPLPAEEGPGRRSLELGATARQGSGPPPGDPPPLDGAAAPPLAMQRAPSGALKRIREEDIDPLLSLLDGSSSAEPSPNPFAAAASLPEPGWEAGGGAPPPPLGAESLAASLNRLAMRTLSLKRQCSRDDTALDALDQALLAERLEAQAAAPSHAAALALGRACSMPTHGSLPAASPRMPPRGPPRAPPAGYVSYEPATEVQRLPPRPPAGGPPFAAAGPAPPQPSGSPFAAAMGEGGAPVVEEALESQLPLMSDRSFNALLFGRESVTTSEPLNLEALVAEANAGSAGPARGGGSGEAAPVASMAGSDWTDGLPSLPSPFGETHGEGSTTQQDVDDLLAEFLGQRPVSMADGRSAELPDPAAAPPPSAFAAAACGSGGDPAATPPSAFASAAGGGAGPGGEVDVMQLASQLVSDPDPVKQMLASRLLQMQQQQQAAAAQAAAAAQQQQQQQRQLLAHHAAHQQMLAHVHAAAVAAGQQQQQQQQQGSGGSPAAVGSWAAERQEAPSPQLLELHSVAQHAQQLQTACLQQRQAVRAMLEQRGVSPSSLAADPEGLAQLTRLKHLKEALAAAQARLAALRSAATAAAPPPSGLAPAFGGVPPLGPPPPLPPLQKETSIGALYSQWQAEESLGLDQVHRVRWEGAPPPQWGMAAAAAPAFVPVPQQHAVLAQRAASAPLTYELDWNAIL